MALCFFFSSFLLPLPLALLLLSSTALAQGPWRWGGEFPSDVLFVKGKKVAGTTVGGIMRRIGHRFGIRFFSPEVPQRSSLAWRSGGRERWILEEFATFATSASREGQLLGWAQEQTLSPRRTGLGDASPALKALADRALRLTVIREPVAHALSACTHFGPCAVKTKGTKIFANTSVAARVDWTTSSLGPAQMWRFITPWPSEVDRHTFHLAPNATQRLGDYYHLLLLADDVDASLVAAKHVVPGLALDDLLYLAAKTTHTGRRPPVEPQPDDFLAFLQTMFYGRLGRRDASGDEEPPRRDASGDEPPRRAPDADLYLYAKKRLDATIDAIGRRRFERDLRRFRAMRARMLAACAAERKSNKRHQNEPRPSAGPRRRRHLLLTEETHQPQRRTNATLDDDRGPSAHPPRLPSGITPRAARECLYGDQGCGYRCIDAWVRDHRKNQQRTGGAATHQDGEAHHQAVAPPRR